MDKTRVRIADIKKVVLKKNDDSFTGWMVHINGSDSGVPASVIEVVLWMMLEQEKKKSVEA